MSESESLWNAIGFLQRAHSKINQNGTALYDATKRLAQDSGNATTATERGLEYAPLIASALVEYVFFDAGVPGPDWRRPVGRRIWRLEPVAGAHDVHVPLAWIFGSAPPAAGPAHGSNHLFRLLSIQGNSGLIERTHCFCLSFF